MHAFIAIKIYMGMAHLSCCYFYVTVTQSLQVVIESPSIVCGQ